MIFHLVTPLMKDGVKGVHGVALLQKALGGDNVLKQNFEPGSTDGEYGEMTARAVKRAKYWFGYRDKFITGDSGDAIYALLKGTAQMTMAQKVRRAARVKQAQEYPMKRLALAMHLKHTGETEHPPNSNQSWATRLYGLIGAWCMMGCSVCGVLAGSKITFKYALRYAYVPFFEHDAREGINKLAVVKPEQLEMGDYVTFHWAEARFGKGGRDGDHVEQFIRWIDRSKGTLETVGSNTSKGDGSQSDGGGTWHRGVGSSPPRYLRDVNYCIRWSER